MEKITDKEVLDIKKEVLDLLKNTQESTIYDVVMVIDEIEDNTTEYIVLKKIKGDLIAPPVQYRTKSRKERLEELHNSEYYKITNGITEELAERFDISPNYVNRIYNKTYSKLSDLVSARNWSKKNRQVIYDKDAIVDAYKKNSQKLLKVMASTYGVSETELKELLIQYVESYNNDGGYSEENYDKGVNVVTLHLLFPDFIKRKFTPGFAHVNSFEDSMERLQKSIARIVYEYLEGEKKPGTR